MRKLHPMDYIYTKKKGSPQTFLELYGKEEIFSMLDKGYIEIDEPYRGNWFITKKGIKAVVAYNPKKYKFPFYKRALFFLLGSVTQKK